MNKTEIQNTELDEPEFFKNLQPEALEYIEFLEDQLDLALEKVMHGRNAIASFAGLLSFIKENFGETADFPVRIDQDFYKDVFLEKLIECQKNVTEFSEGIPLDLDETEIF